MNARARRIWIDVDNSPHVPFFHPIVDELQRPGFAVAVTARDAFNVAEFWHADHDGVYRIQYSADGDRHRFGRASHGSQQLFLRPGSVAPGFTRRRCAGYPTVSPARRFV
jgi:hypothetical protein